MTEPTALRGVLTPVLTPFEDDGRIALDLYVDHVRHLLREGCAGLVPFGTTGEGASVGIAERVAALEALVDAGVDPARLLPGAGLTSLPDTLHLVKAAADICCHGVLVLPPFYFKNVPDAGLERYFRDLAAAAYGICPLYLYHIPQVAGVGIPVSVARRLHDACPETILGVKDSSGDAETLGSFLEIPGFRVYPGHETGLVAALERGAAGCITATGNLNAAAIAEVVRLWDRGERREAERKLGPVRGFRERATEHAPIPAMKGLLARSSGDERWRNVRPPLLPADPRAVETLEARLREEFGFRA